METTQKKESLFKKPWVQSVSGMVIVLLIAGGAVFYKYFSSSISIENSLVQAPIITIGPESQGILDQVYVKTGDNVTAGQVLARVGAEVLSARINGLIISVNNTPGQVFEPSQAVVQMIDPNELRIVGTIKETEGLSDIKVGEPVSFTVDAFSGKTYNGVVESISPTSKTSSVVFSISDQREIQQFDVKVKYDIAAYPEFRNGMSAKIKVFKK